MKKFLLLVAVVCAAVSCSFTISTKQVIGNGTPAEKSFDLPAFRSIKVAGSTDVIFSQGPQQVVLSTDENLIDLFEVEVQDGVLRIGVKKGSSYSTKSKTFVRVSSPDLNGIKIAGSGDCVIKGGLLTDGDFSFSVSGSGDLEADTIECKNFVSHISGSGDIEVESLNAAAADVKINGSGDVKIKCRKVGDVTAMINGSGDITLLGSARSLNSKVNGSGDINAKGLAISGR